MSGTKCRGKLLNERSNWKAAVGNHLPPNLHSTQSLRPSFDSQSTSSHTDTEALAGMALLALQGRFPGRRFVIERRFHLGEPTL